MQNELNTDAQQETYIGQNKPRTGGRSVLQNCTTGLSIKVNNLSKNIARLATVTKYLVSSDKNGRLRFELMHCVLGDRAPFCFELQTARLSCLVYLYVFL